MHTSFQIAVDGPVAAGKGTVCRPVADAAGLLYVDTGAMYRATALFAKRLGATLSDPSTYLGALEQASIRLEVPTTDQQDGRLITVWLDDEDVSWDIRTEEISQLSSQVAVQPSVRALLVKKQQQIAATADVIMEGRDITQVVLPEADIKVFLTASATVRAKRRLLQLQSKGVNTSFSAVYADLLERDSRDQEREADPLTIGEDVWVIDTSDLQVEQVVESIVARIKAVRQQTK